MNKLRLTVENPALTTTKTYDGLTAAQVTAGAITNKVGSEAVTVSAAANYDTKDQGSNKPITVAYTLGGGAMDNYLAPVDYVVNNGVIERRRLTVENPALTTTKTYDGLTAAQVTAGAITNKVGSEAVTVSAAANYDTKDQGSNKPITVAYTLGGGAMDNYLAPVDYVVNNGVIERRRLTVENPALTTTKTYDGLTAAQVTAGAITNKVGSEAVTVSAAANYDTKDQGSNKPITVAYTLGGGAMDNYLAPVDYVVNNGVIERRRLTVENPALTTTKTYDGLTAAQVTAGAITNKVGSEAVTVSAAANYDTKDQGSNKPITVAYTLGGGAMDNYLAPVDYVVNNGVIERRRLTVENPALTTTKTYDGLTAAQVTAGAITNKVGSEAVTVSAAANYDTKDQGSNKPITVAYTLGGGAMDNYLAPVDYVVNNGVIERRRLTVENPALTTTKTYDGLTAAQVTAGAITNKVGSEAVTVSAAANYDTKDQGSNKPITVAYTLGGGAMDNYLAPVDYVVNNGVIERRRLTVENPALTTTKTYDGLTAAQVTAGAITNKVGSEAVTVSAAANYDTKDQGSNKPITVAYTLGGGAMDNYLAPVDYVVNNGVIERRRLTVENPALTTTKTYDGLTAAQVTAGAITNKVGSEAVTVSAAANYDTKDQGSNKPITVAYTLGGGAMDNYLAPVDYVVNNGVIERRRLTVENPALTTTKTYDGLTAAQVTAGAITNKVGSEAVTVSAAANYDTKDQGSNKPITVAYTLGGGAMDNYLAPVDYVVNNGVIERRRLTVENPALTTTKTYDGLTAAQVTAGAITNKVGSEAVTVSAAANYDTKDQGSNKPITVAYTLGGGAMDNYLAPVDYVVNNGVIERRRLTVENPALTTTKTYDGLTAAQVTAGAITNKVGSEAVTVSAAANYDTKDQGSNKPITVAYTLGGGAMDNYLAPVDYVVNNGVIERRRLTVENPALTTTKTYDGLTAAQVTAGAITNKVGSEAVTVSAAANYDTKDQGSNKPITVAYTLGGGAMDNYLAPVDYVVNNGVIERRRLTVENPALTTTKTYDGLTAAQVTAGAITNKVGSEAVTVSAAANYDTKDQGSNKPITVAYTLGGGAMDNYLAPVDYVVNNGVIERRRLTVENPALTTTKTYDGLTAAQVTAGAITNKVGSEAVTVSAAANYDTKDQGSNKPITVAYTLGGGAMDNYLAPVDYVVNNGVIERRRLTVENPALTTTKTYDGLTAAQVTAGAITNKVGSEAVTVSAAANYDTKDQGSNKPITVAYTLGGGAMDNYLAPVDYVVNNGVIERRRLTVENPALTTTKTYDGLTAAQVTAGAITNKVGSEAVTVSAAANYDTKDQGSNKPITVAYTLGGGAMDNYLAPVDYVVNNGVIERRRLTVENPALTTTKTYDGLTAAQVTAGAITNKVGSEAVTVSAAANYDTKDQGSNKPITVAYTLGGGAMDNYLAPVDYVVNNGVIERRRLTVENPALTTTKTYDGLTAAQVTAGAITNKVGSEAVTVSAAANYDTKDQGSNKPITVAYTLGGGAMDNYLAPVDYVVNNGVIEKRAIIVTASANTKAYDGNTSSVAKPTITTGSLANGDVAVFSQLYDTKHVGTGKTMLPSLVSINDASAKTMVNNYQVTLVNSTNGVITAIGLVVKANNVGSQYSDIPSFGYTITGFVNGDDESNSVSGAPSYSSTAFGSNFAITSGPGTYSVMPTIGTLSSNNYTFSFQAGSLTVTAEDAIASYNGQTVFGAQLQNKSYTSNISLSALVNDVDDRSAIGGLRGDVRKAKVNFTLEGNNTFGNTSLSNVEVGLLDPNNSTMGQAVKNNIPVTLTTSEVSSGGKVIEVNNLVGRQLSLAGSVNGYYTSGIALPLPSVITIVVAGSDNVNGGGFIKLPATTNGSYKGSEGSRMNFGLTMKWNKSGANLQGTTNFIYRTTHGKLYQIKSNAINSLNTVTNTTTNESTATINTKAEFRELNADGTIKWFLGNMDLTVVAVQSLNDNTGKSDKISVRLVNPSTRPNSLNVSIPAGLVFTNDMLANGNSALTTLGGGKLNVRNASTTISTTTVSAPIATRTAEMTEQMIVPNKLTASAFPNPAITHFNIKLTSNNTRDAITLRVFNQLGQIVDVKRGLTSGQVIQVGSGYKQGTYYVEVMQGEQKQSLQVVKTN